MEIPGQISAEIKSASFRVDESAIVVDVESYAKRIDARVALGEELGDEGIGGAPWIAGQPSARDYAGHLEVDLSVGRAGEYRHARALDGQIESRGIPAGRRM